VRGSQDFTTKGGLVFHKGRLYVPAPLRTDILQSRHDHVISGHPGHTRTFNRVTADYSWPRMTTFIRRYVQACDICPRMKTPRHKPYGLLQPLGIPNHPWQAITMDFIVKLPISHGFDSIFVICDHLTRAAHFIPCRESMSAPEFAYLFLDHVFRPHGLPRSIVSNRGSVFVSNFWKELTRLLAIDARYSTAYHSQMDGLTEHTNQTLETYLHTYCSYQQDDWVDYLPLAEFSFNSSENTSTHSTPFYANLGFNPSEFHPHSDPIPFSLSEDPVLTIQSILNCQKIGHRYEYFVHWKSQPESENSWIPLSDIPTSANELVDRFHRQHPKAPRPHTLIMNLIPPSTLHDPPALDIPSFTEPLSSSVPSPTEHVHSRTVPAPAASSSVPSALPRPASPPAVCQRLRSEYEPPLQTMTRYGHVSKV
jgi:hypothetical protein